MLTPCLEFCSFWDKITQITEPWETWISFPGQDFGQQQLEQAEKILHCRDKSQWKSKNEVVYIHKAALTQGILFPNQLNLQKSPRKWMNPGCPKLLCGCQDAPGSAGMGIPVPAMLTPLAPQQSSAQAKSWLSRTNRNRARPKRLITGLIFLKIAG